ncbi:MAG: UDP-N-acetylmuramate dehydrogenase [Thermacetogeniaceae bacterium]
MNWKMLADELGQQIKGKVIALAPMRDYTTWAIGGPADLLCIPQTEEDVVAALKFAEAYALPITVIGNGSNLLVRDGGIRGLVIRIAGGLNSVHVEGTRIVAGAGMLLPSLSRIALRAGLSGLEFAADIPASLGGAVVMNAGAFGQCMGNVVVEVEAIGYDGSRRILSGSDLHFDYRTSSLKEQELIVLKAVLELIPEAPLAIAMKMKSNLSYRRRTQPLHMPSAGCVFRNPPGHFAAKLIELAGLKGARIGDAEVSLKHANFIVNRGNASARQVLALIELIRDQVRCRFGIDLVPEIRVVGEER